MTDCNCIQCKRTHNRKRI